MTKEQRLVLLKQIEEQIYVSSLESTLQDDLKSVAIHSIIEEETERLEHKNDDKQIPKQVELMGDGYDPDGNLVYDYAQCPNCQRAFEETDDSWNCGYCPCCGQALNWWGDEEGESTN